MMDVQRIQRQGSNKDKILDKAKVKKLLFQPNESSLFRIEENVI